MGDGVGGTVSGVRGRSKWGGRGAGQSRMGMRSSRVAGTALLYSDDEEDLVAQVSKYAYGYCTHPHTQRYTYTYTYIHTYTYVHTCCVLIKPPMLYIASSPL
jgi:hypothetical protein